jgi:DNA modification methylase
MGSGSVGVAALTLRRRFMGNDVSEEAIKVSKIRLFDHVAYNGNGVRIDTQLLDQRIDDIAEEHASSFKH